MTFLNTSPIIVFIILALSGNPLFSAEKRKTGTNIAGTLPFQPGETLQYEISWLNMVKAGTAVLEVKSETTPAGRAVLRLTGKAKSAGMVDALYSITYSIESVVDPETMKSLSYRLHMSQGKRKKTRELFFDHEKKTVLSIRNKGRPETFAVPDRVQDALSSLYYLRTFEDYTPGTVRVIAVHDAGKNWSEEVRILGRERVKTGAGEFQTIRMSIHPKYEGVFMSKGEILIWISDDSRKIPVLMKHKIKVGTLVITLADVKQRTGER